MCTLATKSNRLLYVMRLLYLRGLLYLKYLVRICIIFFMRYTVELGCKDSKQYFGSALANLNVAIAVCSSTEG